MARKPIKNTTKGTVASASAGGAGAVAGYLTYKYGVPLEITLPVVTVVLGFIGRWAAKLNPNN